MVAGDSTEATVSSPLQEPVTGKGLTYAKNLEGRRFLVVLYFTVPLGARIPSVTIVLLPVVALVITGRGSSCFGNRFAGAACGIIFAVPQEFHLQQTFPVRTVSIAMIILKIGSGMWSPLFFSEHLADTVVA